MEIIDAHQHFWDIDRNYLPWLCDEQPIPFRYGEYSKLRRNYLPPDYRTDAGRYKVIGSVYIEAEFDPTDPLSETTWVSGVRRQYGLPSVMVAQARLDRPDVELVLSAQSKNPIVRGVRHKPAAAATPAEARRGARGSMDDPVWRQGYQRLQEHGLSFDLQTPWWHLDAARDLAADFPATKIILNHTGLPADRSTSGLADWRKALSALASLSNVALKISGLGLPGRPWRVEDNYRVVREAIDTFGVDRIMFASNFPVDSLVADFQTIFDGFATITASFDDGARAAMFRDNARRIYRMEEL